MRCEIEIQYADLDPDQVQNIQLVDLDQALKIIHTYPWDREFSKIQDRTKENLTSTIPSVTIKNKDKEVLTVAAVDRDNFLIELLTPSHRGELTVPINIFENRLGFTLEDIVTNFFDGSIKQVLKLNPLVLVGTDGKKDYKLSKEPLFFLGFSAGLLTLALIGYWSNLFTPNALLVIYIFGAFIIIFGPSILLVVQYLCADWGKKISFTKNGELFIEQRGKVIRIKKGDIDQVVIVESDFFNHRWDFCYARIKTKDEKAFIVTCYIIEPIELVNKLGVNHKNESVIIPTISLDILTKKQKEKILHDRESKKREFLITYQDYPSSKLLQIIGDKKNYADYAIDAATELLEQRKKLQ